MPCTTYKNTEDKKMERPSNKQCKLARLLTGGKATDERIYKELNSMSQTEWNKQCEILNNFLLAHDMPLDEGWSLMRNDFYNIASANHVDNATLFVAYMEWMSLTSD